MLIFLWLVTDVDEVEDLQPVVVAGDVSEKSDNIDVNMNDYNENSDNALLINEHVRSTSKDTSSSVPVSVDVPVVNKYKKYRELVNRSKEKLKTSSFLNNDKLFKAKTRVQKRKFGATKKVGAEGYKLMDVKLLQKLLSNSCICNL